MLAGGIGLAAAASERGWGRFFTFAALAMIAGAVFVILYWWRFRYTVGDGEIVIEKGLLQRQRRVIPFDRVQDIAVERPPLARLFGTARVRIETGGAARDEGNLDMIALADARALRDHIRRGAARPDAEAGEALPEEPVLFAMDLPRLLLSGVFGFSLVFLAAISALAQQLDQFGIVRWEDWFTPERADAAAAYATASVVLILIPVFLLLGLIAGVARTVAADFGFRLTRAKKGLRRTRGLFTLSDVVIPLRRTQVALIESGLLARLLGWHRLSFQTLGADRKEGGVQVAAPFARMEEIARILAEAGFPPPPPRAEFQGVPRRAMFRQSIPWLIAALAAALAAILADGRLGIAAMLLTMVALLVLLRWRKRGHKLGETALFVRSGLLKRRIWIVPYEKTQTIHVSRGPVQRALALASLLVDTAGAPATRAPRMHDLDGSLADGLAERLLAAFMTALAGLRRAGAPS